MISGTLMVGLGDTMDTAKMKPLGPGTRRFGSGRRSPLRDGKGPDGHRDQRHRPRHADARSLARAIARRGWAALAAAVAIGGCTVRTRRRAAAARATAASPACGSSRAPAGSRDHRLQRRHAETRHDRGDQGIDTTILYGGIADAGQRVGSGARAHAGSPSSTAAISGLLFYWECHRTHTVKPPPNSYGYNPYCRTDENPRIKSERDRAARRRAAARARREACLRRGLLGARRLGMVGSRQRPRSAAKSARAIIAEKTPGLPAICGFGARRRQAGKIGWDPGTAANYSNGGCDVVGWYNYSPFGRRHPSNGKHLDWTMTALLPAMARSLEKHGWHMPTRRFTASARPGAAPMRQRILPAGLDARRNARASEGLLRVWRVLCWMVRLGRQRLRIANRDAEQFSNDHRGHRGKHQVLPSRLEIVGLYLSRVPQRRAAPRTPLESPWRAATSSMSGSEEKTCRRISGGTSA